jgi:hypothetical protein
VKRSIQELVRLDLVHREQVGIQRYGTPLYAYNGRDALLDAYDEALDLCCYLRQAIEELTLKPGTEQPAPTGGHLEEPHHRAARGHAEGECRSYFCDHEPHMRDTVLGETE